MKYTCVKTTNIAGDIFFPGNFVNIKRLRHPVMMGGKKYHYKLMNNDTVLSENFKKEHFKRGNYQLAICGLGVVSGTILFNIAAYLFL